MKMNAYPMDSELLQQLVQIADHNQTRTVGRIIEDNEVVYALWRERGHPVLLVVKGEDLLTQGGAPRVGALWVSRWEHAVMLWVTCWESTR